MISEVIFEITPRKVTRLEVALPGTPGTPGSRWLSGSGNPSGASGTIGDWYINNTTKDFFEKTAASTWTLRGTMGNSVVDWSEIENIPLTFAPDAHTHDVSQVSNLLDGDDKILPALLPAIAITDTFTVASEGAMLALDAERGDVAVRSDLNKSFILKDEPASLLSNWTELLTPVNAVLSVNGQTGAVSLLTTHLAEGSNQYFTQARVLATFLTGLSAAVSTPISATDTVLAALAKLQSQINTCNGAIAGIEIPEHLPSSLLFSLRDEISTDSTSETNLITLTLPAETMRAGDSLDLHLLCNFPSGTGGGRKLLVRLSDDNSHTTGQIYLDCEISNTNPSSACWSLKITFHASDSQLGTNSHGVNGTADKELTSSNYSIGAPIHLHINALVDNNPDVVRLMAADVKLNRFE
jgi:hypothetical protein